MNDNTKKMKIKKEREKKTEQGITSEAIISEVKRKRNGEENSIIIGFRRRS